MYQYLIQNVNDDFEREAFFGTKVVADADLNALLMITKNYIYDARKEE